MKKLLKIPLLEFKDRIINAIIEAINGIIDVVNDIKSKVTTLIGTTIPNINKRINEVDARHFVVKVVDELPPTDDGDTHTLYLLKNSESTEEDNIYDEYVFIEQDKKYEHIGSTKIDLSSKQDVIEDLDEIRSGAKLGETSLQEHQSLAAYRTSSAQDIIDANKQIKLQNSNIINIYNDELALNVPRILVGLPSQNNQKYYDLDNDILTSTKPTNYASVIRFEYNDIYYEENTCLSRIKLTSDIVYNLNNKVLDGYMIIVFYPIWCITNILPSLNRTPMATFNTFNITLLKYTTVDDKDNFKRMYVLPTITTTINNARDAFGNDINPGNIIPILVLTQEAAFVYFIQDFNDNTYIPEFNL